VTDELATTPLDALHRQLSAKMVPFAGYAMPVQYPTGILAEHIHCRAAAGLFDVSHMGQVMLQGPQAAAALEALVPGDIQGLPEGRIRYSMFTNPQGGILDDLMITNAGAFLLLVVNAACKEADFAHLRSQLPADLLVEPLRDRALLALQGPAAAAVMRRLAPGSEDMAFMSFRTLSVAGISCWVSRSGYTGEDGFEISLPNAHAEALARHFLADPLVKPIGLGARDSLRLEAGLCLYGADIDASTTPIEAGLAWSISRRRREGGGYPGASVLARQLTEGVGRLRVGLRPEDKAPARAHTVITLADGRPVGEITSGGYGPSLSGPLAMGYVEPAYASPGTALMLVVRGLARPARVVTMPFVPHRYRKG